MVMEWVENLYLPKQQQHSFCEGIAGKFLLPNLEKSYVATKFRGVKKQVFFYSGKNPGFWRTKSLLI